MLSKLKPFWHHSMYKKYVVYTDPVFAKLVQSWIILLDTASSGESSSNL